MGSMSTKFLPLILRILRTWAETKVPPPMNAFPVRTVSRLLVLLCACMTLVPSASSASAYTLSYSRPNTNGSTVTVSTSTEPSLSGNYSFDLGWRIASGTFQVQDGSSTIYTYAKSTNGSLWNINKNSAESVITYKVQNLLGQTGPITVTVTPAFSWTIANPKTAGVEAVAGYDINGTSRVYVNGPSQTNINLSPVSFTLNPGQTFYVDCSQSINVDAYDYVADLTSTASYSMSTSDNGMIVSPLPEPSSLALVGLGLVMLFCCRRRSQRATSR